MMVSLDVAYLLALSRQSLEDIGAQSPVRMKSLGKNKPTFPETADDDLRGKIKTMVAGLERPNTFAMDEPMGTLHLNFSGSERLRGVLGGVKYPVFWMNTVPNQSMQSFKDTMYLVKQNDKAKRAGVNWDDVLNFCLSFYEDRQSYLTPPVIVPDKETLEKVNKGRDIPITIGTWSSTYQEAWYDRYVGNVKIVSGNGADSVGENDDRLATAS